MTDTSDNGYASYIRGKISDFSTLYAFLRGGTNTSSNKSAFIQGHIFVSGSCPAYIASTGTALSSKFAFISGEIKTSISAYMEGVIVANDYIVFTTSDASLSKKFKVISVGYQPESLTKAQSARRTLGGGRDVSMGAVYTAWNPTIRVWVEENRSGYGDLEDLRYFYKLRNPNGTPNNVITFTDHLGSNHEVHLMGDFINTLLGTEITGTEASYIVPLRLEKVTGE